MTSTFRSRHANQLTSHHYFAATYVSSLAAVTYALFIIFPCFLALGMEELPSYGEATSEVDWLSLVAPFVPASSWTSCCLVNRRFYRHFAPRVWQDPLVMIRQLGLHPNDGKLFPSRLCVTDRVFGPPKCIFTGPALVHHTKAWQISPGIGILYTSILNLEVHGLRCVV